MIYRVNRIIELKVWLLLFHFNMYIQDNNYCCFFYSFNYFMDTSAINMHMCRYIYQVINRISKIMDAYIFGSSLSGGWYGGKRRNHGRNGVLLDGSDMN